MKERIISFVLSITILLTLNGCSKNNKNNFETSNITSINFCEENLYSIEIIDYIKELDKINPEYRYTEFYFKDKYIDELVSISKTLTKCQNQSELTYQDLFDIILKNNKTVKNSPFNLNIDEFSLAYSEFYVALNNALKNIYNDVDSISDDFCKLQDLEIVIDDLKEDKENIILGKYIVNENKIIIDYKINRLYYEQEYPNYEITFSEFLTHTIQHELNHARQFICKCRKEQGQSNKSIKYLIFENGELYNCLQGIIEASAESQIYFEYIKEFSQEYIYENSEFSYGDERESQTLLLLLGMFKKDFSIENYYQAIFDSNLPLFYELYDIKDKKDLKLFYNIIYALETNAGRTPLYNHLINNGFNTIGKIKKELGSTHKIYIFREITKDLIRSIENGEFNLEESIYLYNFVKAYIVDEEKIYERQQNGEILYYYDDEFSVSIKSIENIFYSYICKYYEITLEDIENLMSSQKFIVGLNALLDYKEIMLIKDKENDEYEIVNNLIKKFPIIIELTFSNQAYYCNVEKFEEEYEIKLIRELS